ncbi:MAG: hypothetical protein R2939_14645 [Kofleriaceae bacterium]
MAPVARLQSPVTMAADDVLRYCPCCGGADLDLTSHGDPGTGVCRACGAVFTVLSVPSASLAARPRRVARRRRSRRAT